VLEIEVRLIVRRLPRESLLQLLVLPLGQHAARAKLRVTLHRGPNHVGAGPLPLQVGIAPRRAGNHVV
jgi:hypothetical protein